MSHLLSNVEFPEGRRPPPIVEGREADLWLPERNEGSSFVYGALESRVATSRGKEVVETNPSSSKKHDSMTHGSKNIIGHHQIAATSSGHHQIVATTSTDMAAVVSEGSMGPDLDQSLCHGAESQQFEDVEVQISDDEVVYEEEEDVVSSQPVVPFEGMEFDTLDEARRVYNAYAFKMGFSIRIGSTRSSRVSKQVIRKEFECSHARITPAEKEDSASSNTSSVATTASKKKSANAVMTTATRKRSTLKKADCKAHMAVGLRGGRWKVVVFQAEHTHPMVKIKGRVRQLRSHRKISWADYELLKTLHHRNISTMQIMSVLGDFHGGVGNLTFNSKDVSNMRTHLRAGVRYRDMDAVLEYFQKLQAESPSFFYAIKLDAENAVRGLFWVDGRSRELYKCFKDCIFFDTTFCTNRYNMPFAPIVGINNHTQSILLGCALLPDETTETFVWVLQTLKDAMGGIAPTNIMTDQDKAMKAAIEQVFPGATHRCCKFHVLSKACEKFAWLIKKNPEFADEFDYCINFTESPEEFETLWHNIEVKYEMHGNDHFQNMSSTKSMWAPAYFKKCFFPFTSTTGRSESMNSLFKKMVHPQDSVLQFLTQYEYIMETRVEKEYQEAAKGETTNPPLWGRSEIEKQASKFYTRSVFFKFQELLRDSTALTIGAIATEGSQMTVQVLKRVYKEGEETLKTYNVVANRGSETYSCSCSMFDQDGLLCPHILKIFTILDVQEIPQKYLLHRWSEEATLKVPQHLAGPEPVFGVPATNKLRYNALCRKMTQLAADACLGPEEYKVGSEGIDQLREKVRATTKALISWRNDQTNAVGNEDEAERVSGKKKRGVNRTVYKNPPATDPKGRPKDKVDRFKTIVQQVKEKTIKKNKSKAKKTKSKDSACLICHEEGHGVEACKYLVAAMNIRDTELKL